jgi:hypothetical protein
MVNNMNYPICVGANVFNGCSYFDPLELPEAIFISPQEFIDRLFELTEDEQIYTSFFEEDEILFLRVVSEYGIL